MSTITHTLKHPIEIRNAQSGEVIEKITTITIQRPKGKHFRAIKSEAKVAQAMELLGACASLPPSTVDMIDAEDLVPLMEVVGDFFVTSPPIGGKS